ncbi:DUF2958 domain-containing protein [Sphingobium chlorophenolicum]|uniref:Single-stranded DNA endonuclease n=1 Tax=Sphingobium chlorophenolicum TaxID=46429 RepID=A0A081RDL4_SPHCR|nr:DUF2958 domain-containing protein [Sphingobium chlorophenolicum]KEQ53287.1 hypothetical protein BV95_02439 [Sphingobium chlorophenolicum]
MILLTSELHATLRVNADRSAEGDHDPAPVVKFFNPLGAATWLATELYDDGDTLFGLADLGFGCPELGCFSLSELASIRLSFGLGIERDIGFSTSISLSVWADTARRAGSILCAETLLHRAAREGGEGSDLPPSGG